MNLWIAFCWAGTIGLLFANISHGLLDVGLADATTWVTVIAIECSICILSSAIISIVTAPGDRKKYFALIAVVPLAVCMYVSYEASVRVFVKKKHDQIEYEQKGTNYSMYKNDAIGANNALISLEKQGIFSGDVYDKQTRKKRDALAKLERLKDSQSTTSKALTADGQSVDESALQNAKVRAAAMILLAVTFSYLAGLWTTLLAAAKLARGYEFGASQRGKKPQGSSQPSKKKAVELLDMGGESTLRTSVDATPSLNRADSGNKAKQDRADLVAAKKVAKEIELGQFLRSNGKPATDRLSQGDLGSKTSSKASQAAIMDHLQDMGVIQKQGGKRAALITSGYQSEGAKPAETSGGDEVELALSKWGGIDKPTAKRLAQSATGNTTEQRLESALKQHAAA